MKGIKLNLVKPEESLEDTKPLTPAQEVAMTQALAAAQARKLEEARARNV